MGPVAGQNSQRRKGEASRIAERRAGTEQSQCSCSEERIIAMKNTIQLLIVFAFGFSTCLAQDKPKEGAMDMAFCPIREQPGTSQSDPHHQGVVKRGDEVMGFSHEKTAHHFRLYPDGGAIEAEA